MRILHGNCYDLLRQQPDESVHCVVTSPPYWALRDYGTAPLEWPAVTYSPLAGLDAQVHVPAMRCCLGLEPTLDAFVGHLVLIFREVRRVLRADGTLWVNMGDSYAGERDPKAKHSTTITGKKVGNSAQAAQTMTTARRRDRIAVPRGDRRVAGLKNKDLVGQPWRLAMALQADGWWLRRDVIWNKRNPMPESVKDRPTTAHEYLFLLSRSERYHYDADAVREPASENTHPRRRHPAGWAHGTGRRHDELEGRYPPKADLFSVDAGNARADGAYADGKSARMGRGKGWRQNNGVGWGHGTDAEQRQRGRVKVADRDSGIKANASFDEAMADMPATRHKRSVWTLTSEPFKGAHFATFPTALVEPCILAGCPAGGVVLDPFGGSGRVALVADRLGRHAVSMELKAAYVELQHQQLAGRTAGLELGAEAAA